MGKKITKIISKDILLISDQCLINCQISHFKVKIKPLKNDFFKFENVLSKKIIKRWKNVVRLMSEAIKIIEKDLKRRDSCCR